MNNNVYHLAGNSTGTFGGDVAYASNTMHDEASVFLNLTRDAFTLGMNWVGGLSAMIALVLSVICFVRFK